MRKEVKYEQQEDYEVLHGQIRQRVYRQLQGRWCQGSFALTERH
jgi:hypothetical protein